MKEIKISIKEKEYTLKQTFRTYLLFEELTGKQISDIKTMKDMIYLLYCTFKANNKEFEYSFDDFIDVIDENPEIFTKFNEFNTSLIEPEKKK